MVQSGTSLSQSPLTELDKGELQKLDSLHLFTHFLVPQTVNMWLLITAQPLLLNPNILNTVAG